MSYDQSFERVLQKSETGRAVRGIRKKRLKYSEDSKFVCYPNKPKTLFSGLKKYIDFGVKPIRRFYQKKQPECFFGQEWPDKSHEEVEQTNPPGISPIAPMTKTINITEDDCTKTAKGRPIHREYHSRRRVRRKR